MEDRVAFATRTADGGWDEMTYRRLEERAVEVAEGLAEQGVEPGQRVPLVSPPGGEWAATFLGIRKAGAVVVPLDMKLSPGERASLCERSELAGAGRNTKKSWGAVLVWTSGTTGEPKGVELSQDNLDYVVEQSIAVQGTDGGARWLSVLPPNHLLELCCGLLPALSVGSTTFVAGTIVPHELLAMMTEVAVNQMVVVPLVLRLLKRHLEGTREELPSHLRAFYCGGAPLDPDIALFFEDRGVGVYQGYGLTETAGAVAMNSPEHNRIGSVGRPLPGTEVRVSGDGEILVRGPGVGREMIDGDGWLHTGDLGHLDEEGYLYVTGRAKSLIVLDSGKKVQPEEVETALARSDRFAEVAVVGLPGGAREARTVRVGIPERNNSRRTAEPAAGELVCAVVVPAVAMSEAEAEDEVRRLTADLAGFKRPAVVRVVHEELPKTVKRSLRRPEIVKMVAG
jgi:long-chain acyl-CoA synthetase